MKLGLMHCAIHETDRTHALTLPPASSAVPATKPPQLSDRPPGRDRLDIADPANDLKVHPPNLAWHLEALATVAELLVS